MPINKRKAWLALSLVVLMLLPLLSGCWDRTEIDELGYVLAIGIDKGQRAKASFTIWLAVPRQLGPSGGGGGGTQPSVQVGTVEAENLVGAVALLNTYVARRITLEHAKAIVIGEQAAREDVLGYLAGFERGRTLRRNMLMIVARGTAREFLEANRPSIELDPARWMELMSTHQGFNPLVQKSNVHLFLIDEESPGAAPVLALAGVNPKGEQKGEKKGQAASPGGSPGGGSPEQGGGGGAGAGQPKQGAILPGEVPREGLNPAEMIGGAVFKGSKMVATLNGNEVRFMSMIRGHMRRMAYNMPDPKFPGQVIALDVFKSRAPEIKVSYQGTRPVISALIRVEGDVTAISSYYDWTELHNVPVLEQAVSQDMTRHAQALVDRAQKEIGADFLGFGEQARRSFWTWQEWADYRWQNHFPDAKIAVSVHFRVRRVGLQVAPPAPPVGLPQPGDGPSDGKPPGQSSSGSAGQGGAAK